MTDDLKPTMGKNSGPASTTTTEPATWEEIARHLWDLLDDIDTAGDLFKPELEPFERYVLDKTRERFKHSTSDGYEVTFNTRSDLQPRVKGLIWREGTGGELAHNGLGWLYRITWANDPEVGFLLYRHESSGKTGLGAHSDPEELKKLADADNSKAILSALDLAPARAQDDALLTTLTKVRDACLVDDPHGLTVETEITISYELFAEMQDAIDRVKGEAE